MICDKVREEAKIASDKEHIVDQTIVIFNLLLKLLKL